MSLLPHRLTKLTPEPAEGLQRVYFQLHPNGSLATRYGKHEKATHYLDIEKLPEQDQLKAIQEEFEKCFNPVRISPQDLVETCKFRKNAEGEYNNSHTQIAFQLFLHMKGMDQHLAPLT